YSTYVDILTQDSVHSTIIDTAPLISLLYFFLQAEDGIRYRNVTGVQTCALPISFHYVLFSLVELVNDIVSYRHRLLFSVYLLVRSEERRVGNVCRYVVSASKHVLQLYNLDS